MIIMNVGWGNQTVCYFQFWLIVKIAILNTLKSQEECVGGWVGGCVCVCVCVKMLSKDSPFMGTKQTERETDRYILEQRDRLLDRRIKKRNILPQALSLYPKFSWYCQKNHLLWEKNWQKDRETARQTHRQIDRQTDKTLSLPQALLQCQRFS